MGGRCWVLPAAAIDCHHGNASCAQVVICCDIQSVLGWVGGVCTPWRDQPPRTQTKTWGPLHRMRRLATKPSGFPRDRVPQGDTVAQAGAWPWGLCSEGEEGEALWGDRGSGGPRQPPHPKPIIKDDVRGGRGEVT